jgi:hypothetical protein
MSFVQGEANQPDDGEPGTVVASATAVRFLVGHDLTRSVATVLVSLEEERWIPALSPDGADEREEQKLPR